MVGLSKSRFKHWLKKKELDPKSTSPKRGGPTFLLRTNKKQLLKLEKLVNIPVKMSKQKVRMICLDGRSVPVLKLIFIKAGPEKVVQWLFQMPF